MKLSIITLYFLLSISSVSGMEEIEQITTVCDEPSFLKCTNKNKQECVNSFNLSILYCDRKQPDSSVDWNNLEDAMEIFYKCTINSTRAYFDDDIENLNKCLSKTKYSEKVDEYIKEFKK